MNADHGTFCWVESATTDLVEAKKFYTGLFGWTAADMDMGHAGTYSMMQLGEGNAAGLYKLMDEQIQMKIPPHWLSYIRVDDVDVSAKKVTELGGRVHVGPIDIPGIGRSAVCMDPTGATFGLFTGVGGEDKTVTNVPGAFVWNEVMTTNVDQTGKFYCDLLGWSIQADKMPDGRTYSTFKRGDKMAGGLMELTDEMKKMGAPPAWTVYFAVEDCDHACEKVAVLGGRVHMAPTDIPNVGRFAVVSDSTGAAFSVITMTMTPPA